jgi:hypothetical protein
LVSESTRTLAFVLKHGKDVLYRLIEKCSFALSNEDKNRKTRDRKIEEERTTETEAEERNNK